MNLCLAISAQAIAQRSTVMRKTRSDNELFTFRVWLVRLGLNGDEFKNTRDHLLANLEGDRAWSCLLYTSSFRLTGGRRRVKRRMRHE